MTNKEIIEKCVCGLSEDVNGEFCQGAESEYVEAKHAAASTTIDAEDGENCNYANDCYEINQPEGVSVLNEAYEYAKEFIILSEQNVMFKPFMNELREAYLKGFKYMMDGGDYCNIDFSFNNVFYDNLRDVGGGFWAAYKTFLKNAFDAGVNLYVRYSEGKIRIWDIENVNVALVSKGDELSHMELWAKDEIERICKKNNPDFDIFSDDFDYDDSCYKSAFKAYRSICSDGHSGMSYGFTKNILIKLLNEQPLTPIVDKDFFDVLRGTIQYPLESEDYLKEHGLKSNLQCPRRSSLFRKETLDGKVSYSDIDREYCFDIENPSDTYSGFGCKFVDEMFPITMPYHPSSKRYAVACREFLVDKSHGDFDTVEVLYIETPDGERAEINKYFTDGRNVGLETDVWTEVSKEKYDELCEKRLDKVEDKITWSLLWTLTSNSHSDEEIKLLEKRYNLLPDNIRTKIYDELKELVIKYIVEPQKFEYNTFNVRQALCCQNDYYKHELSKIEGLKEISEYLMSVYNLLK